MVDPSQLVTLARIILLTIFTVEGDYFLKKASTHASRFLNIDFLIGILIYASTAFVWVIIYKSTKFSISGVLYSIISLLVFVIIGMTMFGDKLSKLEYIGIAMALSSILILQRYI